MDVNSHRHDPADKSAANRRTGLILLSIALVFFFGAFAARMFGSPLVSAAVLGAVMLLFVALAIGRHLWR